MGLYYRTGKVVIPLHFDWAGGFSEGLVQVEKDGEWFYINRQVRWGNVV